MLWFSFLHFFIYLVFLFVFFFPFVFVPFTFLYGKLIVTDSSNRSDIWRLLWIGNCLLYKSGDKFGNNVTVVKQLSVNIAFLRLFFHGTTRPCCLVAYCKFPRSCRYCAFPRNLSEVVLIAAPGYCDSRSVGRKWLSYPRFTYTTLVSWEVLRRTNTRG